MRKTINQFFKAYYKLRYKRLQRFMAFPHKTQELLLKKIIQAATHTEWGKLHKFSAIKSPEDFSHNVPLTEYEDLKPFIDRMMMGESDVLWPGITRWFSKSSGTTSSKSKYIPVSKVNLHVNHIRGTWDTMNLMYHNLPEARMFEKKTLLMGGSLSAFEPHPSTKIGDVSAIMTKHMPKVAYPFFTPDFETALLPDFEEKIERMAYILSSEKDLVCIGGVPTWTIVLFRRILELTGAKHMLEVWPDLQAYIHGGVAFSPYKAQFQQYLPSDKIVYQEIYNASEGYFAVQDRVGGEGMLLLLDNGIYYEFLPMDQWGSAHPQTVTLKDVQPGINYALIITTNGGLWRYSPGDTVSFVSTNPYRIKITGRTKQYINAFGEELMVGNTDKALEMTCKETRSSVSEYTAAPIYMKGAGKGGHQWLVEFEKAPENLERFAILLDQNLQKLNSDYEAKRYKNMALECLQLRALPTGSFHNWMRSRNKFGGQHKVPRLSNSRKYVEEILKQVGDDVKKRK